MSSVAAELCGEPVTASPAAAAAAGLRFVPLGAEHFFAIDLQESQRTQYGVDPMDISWAEASHYAGQPNCWAALRGDTVLAVMGINETFAGVQGVAFALLARELGRDHFRITRFARDEIIGKSGLQRIEAIVRCREISAHLNRENALHEVLQFPTAQVRWAIAVGFSPVAVLRKFGAAGETHLLLDRIAPTDTPGGLT